ncbi:alkaline phosphatase-like protein [Microthyrium microscopicum]|uniref:GPI ethanolamine phosphate transferase 2 n=1 Tax=Microthyrium microscopicum TaxID=703497 RepID=A0A6A6U4C5_9PEZI|nr:alkaline phosphatase-like protein [Microthyrium microscopicum]
MKLLLALANLLIPVAVLVFATGFFPYKPFIPGLASHDQLSNYGPPPERHFDRLIFMVIDALRSDFVFSNNSGFTYTQSLIRSGEAIPFTAHATPPTITMPRVKAITTGSIPSFLDVILNFAESDTSSTLAAQDTWLAQIRAGRDRENDGRLVMYGDDTWLKLFPDMFARSDGTSSFFVSDFTEVDNNVTRHVPGELQRSDWDAMIMHYLGLDHIGHKAGPTSPNMIPKQVEMDGIVTSIYQAIETQPHLNSTLFIFGGDHGMNDGGNHGGSAPGETSPALVFLAPKLKRLPGRRESPVEQTGGFTFYQRIEQSDLVPTISALLGFPIPKNNLGVMIPEFLPLWQNPKDQLNLLLRNSQQILSIVKATFPAIDFSGSSTPDLCDDPSSDSQALACQWSTIQHRLDTYASSDMPISIVLSGLYRFCKDAQDLMSSTASNYDLSRLALGSALAAIATILSSIAIFYSLLLTNVDMFIFTLITILFGVMMFASSYVEEEQHYWYWISGGWIAFLRFRSSQKKINMGQIYSLKSQASIITLLILHRIIQRWNQTGQKFAGYPDIVTSILFQYPAALWTLVTITYLVAAHQISYSLGKHLHYGYFISTISAILLTICSLTFKLSFTASDAPELFPFLSNTSITTLQSLPLLALARTIFTFLGAHATILIAQAIRAPHISAYAVLSTAQSLLTLLVMTQSRAHNIPLFLLFSIQQSCLQNLKLTPAQLSATSTFFAHTAFFAMGNSNAISSVDLANGYNGVAGYNVIAVGLLVFISNWAGPLWWSVAGVAMLAEQPEQPSAGGRSWIASEHAHLAGKDEKSQEEPAGGELKGRYIAHLSMATFFTSASLLAVMVACTVLRTHLFIWTVFSPKYLYSMAWSLGYHFLVTLGLSGGLWALGKKDV